MTDRRLRDWLTHAPLTDATRVALLGFPSDEGVRRNGGRPGAAGGPAAIREALFMMTPDARDPAPFVEVLNHTADLGDVDRTLMGTFLRVQGKGRQTKDESVPLDPEAVDPLEIYLMERDDADPAAPLFVSHGHRSTGTRLNTRSVRGRINTHLRAAKLKKRGISPHSLTHTAALIWLTSGMPVEEVRRRMRHGTLETTMISFKKQGLLKASAGE